MKAWGSEKMTRDELFSVVIPAPEETWEDFIENAEEIPVLDLRKK